MVFSEQVVNPSGQELVSYMWVKREIVVLEKKF